MSGSDLKDREQSAQDSMRPDFLQDGSHDDLGVDPDQREAEAAALEDRFNSPSFSGSELRPAESEGETPKATEADKTESAAAGIGNNRGSDNEPSLYKPDGTAGNKKSLKRFINKKTGIGGGIAGFAIAGILGLSIFAPILRLESYLARINQRVFGIATSAVEKRIENLGERYIIAHIIGMESCGNVRSSDCKINYANKGLAAGLFNNWRDAKIETRLFDKYGIKLESTLNPDGRSGNHKYTIKNREGKTVDFTADGFKSGEFTGGRRVLGQQMRGFLKEETRWNQVIERRSIRKYMARKHGIKEWCFFKCKSIDSVELKAVSAKTRFKYNFTKRFIYPFTSKYGLIMDCITSGDGRSSTGPCSGKEFRERSLARNSISRTETEEILRHFDANPNQKLGSYVLEKVLNKIFTNVAQKTAVNSTLSSIPLVGQIYLAITIGDTVDRLDTFVEDKGFSKFAARINSSQYLEYYQAMRSSNDELKSHNLSIEEVGILMGQFEGAEDSLVDRAYYGPTATASAATTLFGGKAYAAPLASESDEEYKCNNGKPIQSPNLVCEEKKVARSFALEELRDNEIVSAVAAIANTYDDCLGLPGIPCPEKLTTGFIVRNILKGINSVSDFVLGPIAEQLLVVIKAVPGIGALIDVSMKLLNTLVQWLFGKVFPLPINIDSPGRELRDGLEAGGEFAAYEFAKGGYTDDDQSYGLGSAPISPADAQAVLQDNKNQQDYEYRSQSFFARLTDTEYPNSFANNIATALPNSRTGFINKLFTAPTSLFSSAFGGNMFRSFLGNKSAIAGTAPPASAFGIPQYGYALDSPNLTADPDLFTPEYCAAAKEAWKKSETEDPVTGFEEYSKANPCLLEEAAVESAGAVYTNE